MVFNRVNAKNEAKRIIRTADPAPMKVTMIYILLTSGVGLLVDYFLSDPFSDSISYIAQGYDPVEVYTYVFSGPLSTVAIFISLLMAFYNMVMAFGYKSYTLHLSRGEDGEVSDLFDGFGLVAKIVATEMLFMIFVFFWSMLFVIPGIVASFAYSQAVFCLLDDPDISPFEALRRSKKLMRGEKFNLFVLELSFIGWELAATLGSGIPAWLMNMAAPGTGALVEGVFLMLFNLWLLPYQWIVFSKFYSDLRQASYGENGSRVEF